MTPFENYSNAIFDAFCLHNKRKEIADRKYEIVDKILEFYNQSVDSVLFIGFNPAILSVATSEIFVTEVSDNVYNWLKNQNPDIMRYDNVKKVDLIVACDEYLTFAANETEQYNSINDLCRLANKLVITTVKDYKNQEFKDREYSQPAIIKANNQITAFTEIHDWDLKDKNIFTTNLYQLSGAKVEHRLKYDRRTLYFKQLAKFTMDAGASNFLVHKNLMYKSLLKKNYEHVISISFDE